MLTRIPVENIVLNRVLENVFIEFEAYTQDNVLKVEISPEKLVSALGQIVSKFGYYYKDYTGVDRTIQELNRIEIKIGDNIIKATPNMVTKTIAHQDGWKVKV